jgi:hypothetical protein
MRELGMALVGYEVHVILTLLLLIVSAVLALLCDYLRFKSAQTVQANGAKFELEPEPSSSAATPTGRNSRLAKALTHRQPSGANKGDANKGIPPQLEEVFARARSRSAPMVEMPTGLQEASVLALLARTQFVVSGTVVSIAVTREPGNRTQGFEHSLQDVIETMLQPGELAAPIGSHEYALVFPTEAGLNGPKRLAHIERMLSDQQVRFTALYGASFFAGGTTVDRVALGDALALAQTNRSQRTTSKQMSLLARPRLID